MPMAHIKQIHLISLQVRYALLDVFFVLSSGEKGSVESSTPPYGFKGSPSPPPFFPSEHRDGWEVSF